MIIAKSFLSFLSSTSILLHSRTPLSKPEKRLNVYDKYSIPWVLIIHWFFLLQGLSSYIPVSVVVSGNMSLISNGGWAWVSTIKSEQTGPRNIELCDLTSRQTYMEIKT